jgi:hypothetical protein
VLRGRRPNKRRSTFRATTNRTEPEGLVSNWIETIPGTDIFIGIRVYGPAEKMLDGTYRMPRFEAVE